MSADNFIVVREKPDGFYWGEFSASFWFGRVEGPYPDSCFTHGPFRDYDEAEEDAYKEIGFVEYGVEPDVSP